MSSPRPTFDKHRPAARILLVDEQDHVLLLSNWLESKECIIWVAPGGALNPDESFEQAARRECWEETGLNLDGPLPHVWVREHTWLWQEQEVQTLEHYFFARVERFEPRPQQLEDYEEELSRGHRWWPVDELHSCDDLLVPRKIGTLLQPLLRGEFPGAPIQVGT